MAIILIMMMMTMMSVTKMNNCGRLLCRELSPRWKWRRTQECFCHGRSSSKRHEALSLFGDFFFSALDRLIFRYPLKTKRLSSSHRCSCQEGFIVQGLGLFSIRVVLVFCSPLLLQQIIRNVEHLEVVCFLKEKIGLMQLSHL